MSFSIQNINSFNNLYTNSISSNIAKLSDVEVNVINCLSSVSSASVSTSIDDGQFNFDLSNVTFNMGKSLGYIIFSGVAYQFAYGGEISLTIKLNNTNVIATVNDRLIASIHNCPNAYISSAYVSADNTLLISLMGIKTTGVISGADISFNLMLFRMNGSNADIVEFVEEDD